MNRTTLVILGIAAFLGFAAVMTWSMLGTRKNRVEVCMEFKGQSACRTASGPTRDEAVKTATDNACALIASGMTDTMTCGHMQPVSVKDLN